MKYGDLVSIVVPVYNRAHLIGRTVGCLTAQSYPNIEIVLVDDCSSDDIAGAVAALNDDRVRLIIQPKNGGASAARNAGIQAAKGDLIAFHDSDDLCIFDKIERQMRLFETLGDDYIGVYAAVVSHADVGEAEYSQMHVEMLPRADVSPLSGDMYGPTVRGNVMNLPTMLLKKSALEAVGGQDVRLRNNNDWDLALRLTKIGKFKFLPEPHYLVASPMSKASSSGHISRSMVYTARSFSIITGKLRRNGEKSPALAKHYATTAGIFMRLGRVSFARRYIRASLAIAPMNIRNQLMLLCSYFPKVYFALRNLKNRGKPEMKV